MPYIDYYKSKGLVEEIDAGNNEQFTFDEAIKILKK